MILTKLPSNVNSYKVTEYHEVEIKSIISVLLCRLGFKFFCPAEDVENWVTKYIDPVINPVTHPVSIEQADFYVLSGYMTGNIKTVVDNIGSSEGKSYEENTVTGETRNYKNIQGSANVDHKGIARHIMKDINELLAKVENTVYDVAPSVQVNPVSTFRKDGYYDMLLNIYNYFMNGNINIQSGIDVLITYQWFGTKQIKQHVDVNTDLPVSNVNWHVW